MSEVTNLPNRLTRQSSKSIENFLKLTETQDRVKETTKNFQKGKIFKLYFFYNFLEFHLQRLELVRSNLSETRKDDWKYSPIPSTLESSFKSF